MVGPIVRKQSSRILEPGRDTKTFPPNRIGNLLFALHVAGCDLSLPIDVVVAVDFRSHHDAEVFQVLAASICSETQLFDFTYGPDDEVDVSVELRYRMVATCSAIAEIERSIDSHASRLGGRCRTALHDPRKASGWTVFRR